MNGLLHHILHLRGPSSGIGLETSILFASEGANVILADINFEAAEKAAALISKKSPNVKAIAVKADVGKEEDIKAAVDKAVQEFGRLDVIVRATILMSEWDGNLC